MNGRPPMGMPPATDPGLLWRRARKLYVCDGNGAEGGKFEAAPGCTRIVVKDRPYLICTWGDDDSLTRHCEHCARLFFAEYLDTRSLNAKEEAHA